MTIYKNIIYINNKIYFYFINITLLLNIYEKTFILNPKVYLCLQKWHRF